MTNDEIYRAFYDDYPTMKAFLHSHSYTANPLACAVAVEVLKIFEEEDVLASLIPKVELLESWRERFEAHPHVGELRRCGMIAAVEMVQDKQHRTPYPWQERRGLEVYKRALAAGALLRPLGNVTYFMPPLSITLDELQSLLEIAYNCIDTVTTDAD